MPRTRTTPEQRNAKLDAAHRQLRGLAPLPHSDAALPRLLNSRHSDIRMARMLRSRPR